MSRDRHGTRTVRSENERLQYSNVERFPFSGVWSWVQRDDIAKKYVAQQGAYRHENGCTLLVPCNLLVAITVQFVSILFYVYSINPGVR